MTNSDRDDQVWQQTLKLIDQRPARDKFSILFANTYINDVYGDVMTVVVDSATAERYYL